MKFNNRLKALRSAVAQSILNPEKEYVMRRIDEDTWMVGEWNLEKSVYSKMESPEPWEWFKEDKGKLLGFLRGELYEFYEVTQEHYRINSLRWGVVEATSFKFKQESENVRKEVYESNEESQPREDCGEQNPEDR